MEECEAESSRLWKSHLGCRFGKLADSLHPAKLPMTIFADKHRRDADVVVARFALTVEKNHLGTFFFSLPRSSSNFISPFALTLSCRKTNASRRSYMPAQISSGESVASSRSKGCTRSVTRWMPPSCTEQDRKRSRHGCRKVFRCWRKRIH